MTVIYSVTWDDMMLGSQSVRHHFAAQNKEHTALIARGLADVIMEEQKGYGDRRQRVRIFNLGIVSMPDVGKSFFADHLIEQGGAFTPRIKKDFDQVAGASEKLGWVVRADTYKMLSNDEIIGDMRRPWRRFARHAMTRKGLDIVEHPEMSGRGDFHVIVCIRKKRALDDGEGRDFEFFVQPLLEKRAGFQAFLERFGALRIAA